VAPTLASMSELIELNVSHNNIRSMSGFPALKALMVPFCRDFFHLLVGRLLIADFSDFEHFAQSTELV
jgi:hypothetical protein